MNRSLITIWLVGLIAIFCMGLLFAHTIYTMAMKDFHVQNTGYTEIEVKPVPEDSFQTDQAKLYQVKNVQEQ